MAPKPKSEVTVQGNGSTALAEMSELDREMMESSGQGASTDQADNIVPQISVLGIQSPEVLEGPDQVPGAVAGDFLVGKQLIKGKEGFWFQPAILRHDSIKTWMEFIPIDKGGGFVAIHPYRGLGIDGTELPPPGTERKGKSWVFEKTGNEAVFYCHVPGILWLDGQGLEYVIPFKSTGHTVLKNWNTESGRYDRMVLPDGQMGPRPVFAHIYKLTSEMHQNASGKWYLPKISAPILLRTKKKENETEAEFLAESEILNKVVGDPFRAYRMGKALSDAFLRSEKRADVAASTNEAPAAGASGKGMSDDIPF